MEYCVFFCKISNESDRLRTLFKRKLKFLSILIPIILIQNIQGMHAIISNWKQCETFLSYSTFFPRPILQQLLSRKHSCFFLFFKRKKKEQKKTKKKKQKQKQKNRKNIPHPPQNILSFHYLLHRRHWQ